MLEDKIKSGVIWSTIERFSIQGVQFLMTIIISRFVMPEDYGLVAMLGILIAVANSLVDCGFSNAIVQKIDRTDTDFSTVFYFNTVVSILLYIILYFSAPLIASFYEEPKLDLLTKVICTGLVLRSLSIVQNARFQVAMNFKILTKASLISAVISGIIGIAMAVLGYGVWSIVAQSVLSALIQTFLLWVYAQWLPKMEFSIESFKNLFGFGSKLMLSGLLHTIYLNLYTLVIGKYYNAADVGYYNRANSLAQYPSTNIVGIANRVFYPALCELQADLTAFESLFHRYLRMSCFIVFPLSIGIAAIAEPLISLLLTETWLPAVLPLQIISIAYLFYPILLINNQPLQCLNHPTMFINAEIVKKITALCLLCISLPFGLKALCLSVLVYNICDSIIIIFCSRRIMQTGFRMQFKQLSPILTASVIMGSIVYFVSLLPIDNNLLKVLLAIFVGFASYIGLCICLNVEELNKFRNALREYV